MARSSRWEEKSHANGILHVRLSSWKYFHDYVRQEFLDFPHYVWRGQRDAAWPLESSLDCLLKGTAKTGRQKAVSRHLEKFKLASRGRRGPHPQKIDSENEWWALAQHNAMATPLLDWTESPFVALYFAFEKEASPNSGDRAVWAMGGASIAKKNAEIKAKHGAGAGPVPTLDFIRPVQDENSRLVGQAGLFTRAPLGVTVDEWISQALAGVSDKAILLKISIPSSDRPECLRTLNRMNINHLSLFPDLYGAGVHCNNALRIKRY